MIDITNYNNDNIFAKILRQEIPSKKVFENDVVYAFEDINPQAPIHILIIPHKEIAKISDTSPEDKDLLGHLLYVSKKIADKYGYQLVDHKLELYGIKKK